MELLIFRISMYLLDGNLTSNAISLLKVFFKFLEVILNVM